MAAADQRGGMLSGMRSIRYSAPDANFPLRVGDKAPDFDLPAVDREGNITLGDYLRHGTVLLGLFRAFTVHSAAAQWLVLANLGGLTTDLASLGVQTFGVVATPTDHARLYFKHHRAPIPLGADPAMTTQAAYGLPKVPKDSWDLSARVNLTGELREALPIWEANKALGRLDKFKPTQTDRDDMQCTWIN